MVVGLYAFIPGLNYRLASQRFYRTFNREENNTTFFLNRQFKKKLPTGNRTFSKLIPLLLYRC